MADIDYEEIRRIIKEEFNDFRTNELNPKLKCIDDIKREQTIHGNQIYAIRADVDWAKWYIRSLIVATIGEAIAIAGVATGVV